MTNRQRIHALLRELGYTKANLHHGVYRDATGSTWERDDSYIDECDGGDADDALLKRIVESHPAEAAKLILSQWGDELPEPTVCRQTWERPNPHDDVWLHTRIDGYFGVWTTGGYEKDFKTRPEAIAKVRELLGEK